MTYSPDQPPGQPSPQSFLPPIPVPPPPPPPPPPGGFPPDYSVPPYTSPQSFTWQQAWRMALTEPGEDTYIDLINDPQASPNRAYIWVGLVSTAMFAASIAGQSLGLTFNLNRSSSASPGLLVLCLPFVGVLAVLGLIIGVGIQNFVARILGGEGSFDKLVYAYASFYAPLSLISSVLSLVPCVGCFSGLLGLYGLVLNVIAVKAVHRFDWGRAALTVFWWVPLMCLCVFAFICVGGPVMGNVLQNILTEVATPQR
jgi:hypothetical protein